MRFILAGGALAAAAIAGRLLGADVFHAYPSLEIVAEPGTLVVSATAVAAGLAPWRKGARGA
jgi:hypothetical protein